MKNEVRTDRDPRLWNLAKKRAEFKSHFYSYIIINGFLWLLWVITTPAAARAEHTPWPVWPLIGWGLGLAFHFVFTYIIKYDENEAIEKEYQKFVKKEE